MGSVLKNWVSMKMPNTFTRFGTMSAPSRSISPRSLTMRNVGIRTTCKGTIKVASNRK